MFSQTYQFIHAQGPPLHLGTPDNSALCSSIWRYSRDTLSTDYLLLGKLSTEQSSMGNNFGTATFNDEMIAEYANLSGLSENQVNNTIDNPNTTS